MENKEKVDLFYKIIAHIDNKFCENKLDISMIALGYLPKDAKGQYDRVGIIRIKEKETLKNQIEILSHELAHAYQYKFLEGDALAHNKTFEELFDKFNKEIKEFLGINNIKIK